jgi:hypothetical protein
MHLITFALLAITTHALPLQNSHTTAKAAENTPRNIMHAPPWLHAVTFPLICYDIVIVAVLCWLWASGHLEWLGRPVEGRRSGVRVRGVRHRSRDLDMEREMRRVGLI